MKVLFISTRMPPTGCGVALYNELMAEAFIANGLDLTVWYPSHPVDPISWGDEEYDVVHHSFHGGIASNCVIPRHLPKAKLYSILFHDVDFTYWNKQDVSNNIWWEFCKLPNTLACHAMDFPGCYRFDIPVPVLRPMILTPNYPNRSEFVIGHTGLRGDGVNEIISAASKHPNWTVQASKDTNKRFISLQEEINRLSLCDVIVAHYYGGQTGQGLGSRVAIAAQRPLIIDNRLMNTTLFDEPELYHFDNIEEGLLKVKEDLENGVAKIPFEIGEKLHWTRFTRRLILKWCELIGEYNVPNYDCSSQESPASNS